MLDRLLDDLLKRVRQIVREAVRAELAALPHAREDTGWLTVADAAQYTGYRAETIRRMCRRGRIDASQVSRRWRIQRSSLDNFVTGSGDTRTTEDEQVDAEVGRLLQFVQAIKEE